MSNLIVRRPPPPPLPPGANDVLREARLLQALADKGVPVPAVLATGEAGVVFDVPFYVMNFVAGVVITNTVPATLATTRACGEIGMTMVNSLSALHALNWRAAGLDNFGKSDGFNARHLGRIARLVSNATGDMDPRFADVHGWLIANAPPESGASVIHNDYRLGNLMWAHQCPVRLLAILDWELATVGDPLFDLAYLLNSIPQAGEAATPTQQFGLAALQRGFPSRSALAAHYESETGRTLEHLHWYRAFADWKLAVLYDFSRRRGNDSYYKDPSLTERFLIAARGTLRQSNM